MLLGDALEVHEFVNPRVIDEDINCVIRPLCFNEKAFDIRLLRHVGLDGDCPTAFGVNLVDDLVCASLAGSVVDDDRGAFFREALRDGRTDPLGCPGHDRYLA